MSDAIRPEPEETTEVLARKSEPTSELAPNGSEANARARGAERGLEPATLGATPENPANILTSPSLSGRKAAAFEAPERGFGDYELLSEVARGGMGVVYRARQIKLDRVVALKMILGGRLAQTDDVVRFRTEAEAAARLSHPNIVAVFEVGEQQGQHYFTMEFVEGESLSQKLVQGALPPREAARYVRQMARGIHYAHQRGIIHRDLKPSNIIIDPSGEPQITDFGLAKRLDNDSKQTRTGAVLGTPSYMAPEQAQGRNDELGPPADIYSLGAILYELVTGRPPFRAANAYDTVMQVINNEPPPPKLLNPELDSDLENIILKCMEKEPLLRYSSAAALADDLDRYLNGESIQARSVNVIDRLARMLGSSRHAPAFSTWSSMIFIMAAVIAVEHVVVWILIEWNGPRWLVLLTRTTQFALLGALFWYNRGRNVLPTSVAERELWSIWIGYFLAYPAIILVTRLLLGWDVLEPSIDAPERLKEILPYPFLSVSAGLAFFAMGSNYWGRCYLIGIAFFVVAVLMPLDLELAPLLFGFVWAGALVAIGRHLQALGKKARAAERAEPNERPTLPARR
ncbi:MAG: serine/threonine-protein kinase [Gemmataceae bacterium]